MKILLVANYELDRQESMRRFAGFLQASLTECGHDVRVSQPTAVMGSLVGDRSVLRKWLGYIDKLLLFPRELQSMASWADVVHICDHSNAVYSSSVGEKPVVVTCHDLLAVRSALGEIRENPTGWSGRIYQWLIRRGLGRSPAIVCSSESTRIDVEKFIEGKQEILAVVQLGLNYPYSPMGREEAVRHLKKLGLVSGLNFLLHVGGNQWYKNRMGVLRIFCELTQQPNMQDIALILAGKHCTAEMDAYIAAKGIDPRVTVLTGVDNEQLRALYSAASGLLFPSLHEGFGWPIVEAHACGCPVFTTQRPPMTEVGGESAIYIDPKNSIEAAGKIAAALASGEGAGEVAQDNARRFTSGRMIDGYISVYERVIDKPGSSA